MGKIKAEKNVDYIKVLLSTVDIIIPLTHKGSKKYGMYTSWCTAAGDSEHFNDYTKRGILIYFIMKNEVGEWRTRDGDIIKTNNKYAWFKSFDDYIVQTSDKYALFFKSFDDYDGSWWNINDKKINKPLEIPWKETKLFVDEFMKGYEKYINFRNNKIIKEKLKNGVELDDDEINYYGNLGLMHSSVKSLRNLKSVRGDLMLQGSSIKSLGKLERVGGCLNLKGTKMKSLGRLESVGEDLYLQNSKIRSLGKLKSVGGNVYIENTELTPDKFKNIIVGGDIIIEEPALLEYPHFFPRSSTTRGPHI